MKSNLIKLTAIALFVMPLIAMAMFRVAPVTVSAGNFDDAAATYTAKCAMCHSPKAAKFFDATKADADLVQIILNGKKGDKPPAMPEFKSKGIDEPAAQGLVTYMKSLKAAN